MTPRNSSRLIWVNHLALTCADNPPSDTGIHWLIVTDMVLLPVVEAMRYQISLSFAVVRVLVASVNAAAFQEPDDQLQAKLAV